MISTQAMPEGDVIKRVLDNAIQKQLTDHYTKEIYEALRAQLEQLKPKIRETVEENLKGLSLENAKILHDMFNMQDKLLVAYAFNPEPDKPIECEELGEAG